MEDEDADEESGAKVLIFRIFYLKSESMMDKQKLPTGLKSAGRILFWIIFVVFFVASYRSIVDLDGLNSPRRWETLVRIFTALSQPNFSDGETVQVVLSKMLETFEMGFLATTISAVLANPLTFVTARSSTPWGRGFKILLQPVLLIVRSIHPLVGAIFAVMLTGLGPAAGVLAIAIYSTAVLIGIFSEYAQEYTSLRWAELIKVYFPGLAFKHLPVNLLIATVIGFVGAGGIGFFSTKHQPVELQGCQCGPDRLYCDDWQYRSGKPGCLAQNSKKAELNQTI